MIIGKINGAMTVKNVIEEIYAMERAGSAVLLVTAQCLVAVNGLRMGCVLLTVQKSSECLLQAQNYVKRTRLKLRRKK